MLNQLLIAGATLHADAQRRRFQRDVQRAAQVQDAVLRGILLRHADSAFGRTHGFAQVRNLKEFAARVPIREHEQLRPWLDRVYEGDFNALLGARERILMFALSSGSTDQPKRIPVTTEFLHAYRRGWNIFGIQALRDHPEGLGRCLLQVVSPMEEYRSPTGLPCGAISGLLAAKQKRVVRRFYANPSATAEIANADARYYTIMRLAVPRDVAWIVTPNPATTLKLVRTAALHAERLIRDVHDGTLSPLGDIEPAVHARIVRPIRPDRKLAQKLSADLSRDGKLLPRHYWRLSFLANWMGGTLRLYLQEFPAWFGDIPVRDIGLLATEGRVSIPLADGTPAGVLDPRAGYFEFVPEGEGLYEAHAAFGCHDVKPGGVYRVVLTNAAGLYRYDLGDYVRVHGFMGEAPCVEFLHRGNAVSSFCGEKLTEWQVVNAYERVATRLGMGLARFLLSAVWDDPPRYRLHIEGNGQSCTELAHQYDEALAAINLEYGSKRSSGRIGPIELNVVPVGRLLAMDESRRKGRGAAHEQFKQVHLINQPGDDLEIHESPWLSANPPVRSN